MRTEKFNISGMTCTSCVGSIEKTISKLNGIKTYSVSLLTNSMIVTYDDKKLNNDIIEQTVSRIGYPTKVEQLQSEQSNENAFSIIDSEKNDLLLRFILSALFLIPLMYLPMAHMFHWPYPTMLNTFRYAFMNVFLQFWLTLPIIFINRQYFISGTKSLLNKSPNMDALISMGVFSAMLYGVWGLYHIHKGVRLFDEHMILKYTKDMYFESAGTILTLITLGKYLEAKSKSKTSFAIRKLMALIPKKATVIRDKVEIEIPVEEVVVGDLVTIHPGQQIPVDGIVFSGNSSVDESALTGESMPVFKQKGDKVLSASINKAGFFTITAEKVGKNTTLAQIILLVEEAANSKAPISKLADKISAFFVPAVFVIAVVTGILWILSGHSFNTALSTSISVLVISCPCALGLATPVAIMVSTGKAAEMGILIKSAEIVQQTREIDTIVLDKTGTITEGRPHITDIVTCNDIDEEYLLQLAYSIEQHSEHPIADAIVRDAASKNLEVTKLSSVFFHPGLGVEAEILHKKYLAGNLRFLTQKGINCKELESTLTMLSSQGKTAIMIAEDKQVIGIIAVADVVKKTSKAAVDEFKKLGLEVIMLTGDNALAANYIQQQLGLDNVISEVLPHEKDAEIMKLQRQGKIVAMVGDGINDAPALVRSDLGIAIGAGTDIAIDSADIVLMQNDLVDAVSTIRLSKKTMAIIRENLFWAFFYNVICIPLAAGVFYHWLGWKLNPTFAAVAMSLSSISVVLNSLRILRFKPVIAVDKNESDPFYSTNHIKINITENKNSRFKFIMEERTVFVSGMTCSHCSARVEKALNAIEGIQAVVDLENNKANITLTRKISNDIIRETIENVGYQVTGIL